MKGIIMAGGEGTRLRPLTCDCPKPMIRLMGKPLMEYAVGLLKRHGIEDIAVTLGYQPDAITAHFGDGADFGVRLRYTTERAPLGTAGGVRQAVDFLDETFAVLSGDGLTDLDLTAALAFHRERGALATLVLKRSDEPMEYGVVDVDADGRVRSFHEKPDWSEVLSDTVNTGIYILEPEVLGEIPEGRVCDFGRELFPRLVDEGRAVYGYVADGYWCDVGDVAAYLRAHIDCMEGRVHLDGLPAIGGRALQLPGAVIDRAAVLEGPCLIASGAQIRAGAYVGPYSVIGENCVVGEGASVKRGVLWPGSQLKANAQARGCVLAESAVLGEGAQAYEESVLGASSAVDARGVLLSGVKLWPGKRVGESERLDANRVWGCREAECAAGTLPVDSPADAARAAQACAAALKPREIVLGHGDGAMAEALKHAAVAGCMAQGVRVIDAGACATPHLRHAQRAMAADAALFIEGDRITPLNALGAVLPRRERRTVEQLNARGDFTRPTWPDIQPVLDAAAAAAAYVADAASRFDADPRQAPPIALYSESVLVRRLAEEALLRAGLSVRVADREADAMPASGEIGVILDPTGTQCAFSDEYGGLTDAQHQLLTAWTALGCGERTLLLPDSATRGIDALLTRCDAIAERVGGEPARWMNMLARRFPLQFELRFDGLMLALRALSLLTEKELSLAKWRREMPEVHRRSRVVPIASRQGGQMLSAFARTFPDAALDGGVRVERDGGWAWIGAGDSRSRLRVIAEGASAEFADELCDFCAKELMRLRDAET